MNIEPGLIVVIAATLIFYLRLILLQREQAKRLKKAAEQPVKPGSKRQKSTALNPSPRYSILSSKRRDWIIAGLGIIAILAGVLLNRGIIFPAQQVLWWLPTSAGIIAFGWAFRLP
jgi:hypothetical protein